jgi:endonuclease YncB( thermonuclease family)
VRARHAAWHNPEIDAYKRTLRYVVVGKRDVGRALVGAGWTDVDVYGGKAFKRLKAYRGRGFARRSRPFMVIAWSAGFSQ